jgi:hypothetical protein
MKTQNLSYTERVLAADPLAQENLAALEANRARHPEQPTVGFYNVRNSIVRAAFRRHRAAQAERGPRPQFRNGMSTALNLALDRVKVRAAS